jgi:hypothetical protein
MSDDRMIDDKNAVAIGRLPPDRIDEAIQRLTHLAGRTQTPQRVAEDLIIVLTLAKSHVNAQRDAAPAELHDPIARAFAALPDDAKRNLLGHDAQRDAAPAERCNCRAFCGDTDSTGKRCKRIPGA